LLSETFIEIGISLTLEEDKNKETISFLMWKKKVSSSKEYEGPDQTNRMSVRHKAEEIRGMSDEA
jgi:hypothetical protein